MVFTNVEITGCINEAANGDSYYDFMILIVSFISSFEINKINPFPALTALFPIIFLSNLFIAFEAKLLANPGKLSLAK